MKSFKKSNNIVRSYDAVRTGLVTPGTFNPLGVKNQFKPSSLFRG
jgi:hypothetical protein